MELVWDIDYAVLRDGSGIVDLYIRSMERLFGAAMKKTDKLLFLVLRFLKATPFVVFISIFMVWSVLLCSCTRCASISLAFHLD